MRFLSVIGVLCLLLVGCSAAATPTPDPNIRVYSPPLPLVDFQLIDTHGELMKLSALHGKVAIISFGFTYCPDVCPVNLANYVAAKKALGAKADKVAFVFISVDGERDTPPVLAEYLSKFDSSFIGLTGDETRVRPVASIFAVRYEKYVPEGSNVDYLVSHTATWFLVNEAGALIRSYAYGMSPEAIAQDVAQFIS
ncbi:MAG: SCO family protein [Anaerolineae bacterium]|nr:SCO family protein [Anaerolineae bacterium]